VTYIDPYEDAHHGVGSEILKLSEVQFRKAHP
jgi:hypothetical protein